MEVITIVGIEGMQEGGLYGLPPNGKHLHQRLLPAIHQFSEPERQGNSSCEPCYHCPYFEEEGRDQSCVSPSQDYLPGLFTQPELAKWQR